jgi:hypothetical protein
MKICIKNGIGLEYLGKGISAKKRWRNQKKGVINDP